MNTRQNFGIFKSREDIEKIIEKIVEIGKKLNKKVVATGDVFVLDEKDMIYREILHVGQKKKNANIQSKAYFRTTDEMLKEFKFLGEEKAKEIVVDNSNYIYEMIEKGIRPISKDKATPYIVGCEDTIKNITYSKAEELYRKSTSRYCRKKT